MAKGQPDLFSAKADVPEGFRYAANVLVRAQEEEVVGNFATLEFAASNPRFSRQASRRLLRVALRFRRKASSNTNMSLLSPPPTIDFFGDVIVGLDHCPQGIAQVLSGRVKILCMLLQEVVDLGVDLTFFPLMEATDSPTSNFRSMTCNFASRMSEARSAPSMRRRRQSERPAKVTKCRGYGVTST